MNTSTVPAATTLRLLAASLVVLIPHFANLPFWACGAILGFGIWRAIAARRYWPMPARWARLLILALVVAGVFAQFGRINGQYPGTTLLVLLLGVKLLELKTPRDHAVLALFGYVTLATQFLFSQELPQIIWLLLGSLAITMALLDLSRPDGPLPWRETLKRSSALLIQSIPLMLVIFVLFPRIPGPLWGIPADAGQASIGLSDSMSPGSISGLTDTGAVAFRVRFSDSPPDTRYMYWRGPVFWQYDGRSWRHDRSDDLPRADFQPLGETIEYQITLEAHRKYWLFALDMPVSLPEKAHFTPARQVLSRDKVRERRLYRISSANNYQLETSLPDKAREWGLQLPALGNSRTRDLAKQWRDAGLTDEQISQRALRMFREEGFIYSLQVPLLGRDSVDEFLFGTRQGFCEHYAGAFTFLMRAAGIPARVVTGYQGAERNAIGDYYIVRQSDAHAWSEIWLQGRGWVRVDPTSAVSPDRIEIGLAAAVGETADLPFIVTGRFPLMHQIQMRWDWINQNWYEWVLAYGPELQKSFLGKFGLADWGRMILALTVVSTLFLAILGTAFIWQSRRAPRVDAVQKIWLQYCKRLARRGLQRHPHEGPMDFMHRCINAVPAQREEIEFITRAYLRLRYGQLQDQTDWQRWLPLFRQRVARFRPA